MSFHGLESAPPRQTCRNDSTARAVSGFCRREWSNYVDTPLRSIVRGLSTKPRQPGSTPLCPSPFPTLLARISHIVVPASFQFSRPTGRLAEPHAGRRGLSLHSAQSMVPGPLCGVSEAIWDLQRGLVALTTRGVLVMVPMSAMPAIVSGPRGGSRDASGPWVARSLERRRAPNPWLCRLRPSKSQGPSNVIPGDLGVVHPLGAGEPAPALTVRASVSTCPLTRGTARVRRMDRQVKRRTGSEA